ncbi:MAG: alpha/beta hydrolase [Crocosphaera sp.]|nr:alpha/beta hydrolase [Crocosphaera sp.]
MRFISPFSSSSGPLLIYFPGMDGTGELFYKQGQFLSQYFQIRCLSLSSYDKSNWSTLVYKAVNLIKQELDLCSHSSVYLCGESFGGCLGLKVACQVPDLVEKMILVNPASSFNKRPFLKLGVELNQWLPNFVYQGSTVILLWFLGSLNRMKKRDSEALLKAMQSLPQEMVSWRLSLLRDFTIHPKTLKELNLPVLILASQQDQVLPSVEEGKELLKYFPNARLKILPKSGHACLLEEEIDILEILKQHGFIYELKESETKFSAK